MILIEAKADGPDPSILFDTGATSHMFKHKSSFDKNVELPEQVEITVGNGQVVLALGRGEVRLKTSEGGRVRLLDVLQVPALMMNLVSGTRIMNNEDLKLECDSKGVKVTEQR